MRTPKRGDDKELVKKNISSTPPVPCERVKEDGQAGVPRQSQLYNPRC